MHSYAFANADHSMVVRDNSAWILWEPVLNQPLQLDSLVGDEWKADGKPIPVAYREPHPSTMDVDAFAAARLRAGYADGETGKTWQCDDASLTKWIAIGASAGLAVAMSVTPLPTFTLIAADNTAVVLTAAQAFALFNVRVMPWVSATMLYARTMKNNILAGNPPANITAEWP